MLCLNGFQLYSRWVSLLISYNWTYRKKKEAKLILQSGIYIYFNRLNISDGTAFLLRGITYNDKVKLRRCDLKQGIVYNMIL